MRPSYQQVYSIKIPEEIRTFMNKAQIEHLLIKEHRRQKTQQIRLCKDEIYESENKK